MRRQAFERPPETSGNGDRQPVGGPRLASTPPPVAEPVTIVGDSPELAQALDAARRVAGTDASVFITGETGTGKELVALYVHEHSRRRGHPFVAVNCAALPESLFESELFGHRRGAFTGAVRDKPGILETAHGGTVFLDELLDMPKAIQAKLLRVLQDGIVRRVGSETPDAVDVRVICATNRDPEAAIRAGDLRVDLFYRLHVVPIHLPPLRERPADIPPLVSHFLTLHWTRHRGSAPRPTLSPEARWALAAHPWRGNVRELQNTIEHLVVVAEPGATITPDRIPFRKEGSAAAGGDVDPDLTALPIGLFHDGYQAARQRVVEAFEARYLEWFVQRAGGNFAKAARLAGIDRTTVYRLLERQGLPGSRARRGD